MTSPTTESNSKPSISGESKAGSQKTKFYLGCFAMAVALILPWYNLDAQTDLGSFGGGSVSASFDGTKVTGGYLVLAMALGAAYCKIKDLEWSALCVIANILIGVLALMKKLSVNGHDIGMNGSASFGGASASANVEFGYGLYILLVSAAFCLFTDLDNFKKLTLKLK